jgi:hypothetical protein
VLDVVVGKRDGALATAHSALATRLTLDEASSIVTS